MTIKTTNESRTTFPGLIAVSGAAGRFGRLLIRRLHRTDNVISIDRRPFPDRPSDVEHLQAELRQRDCRDLFRRRTIKALVHLGPHHTTGKPGDAGFANAVENFSRLLDYCDTYQVHKLVILSSFDVYGARPTNPQFLTEEAPLLAENLSALRDVDMMAQSFFWKRPDIETVILRPTNITGYVSSALIKYLSLDPVPRLAGYDPMLQLVHEEDVIQAILLALKPGHRGIFNVAGPRPIPISRVISRLRKESIAVPHILARPALRQLKRLGKITVHPAHVDYIRYICMIDDSRAKRELGYKPQKSLNETILAIDLWN